MNKLATVFSILVLCFRVEAQDILVDRESRVSFFSEAPLENISAVTQRAVSALNIASREIAFKVPIKSFDFRKRLMQEHFNENYMESDRFPYATFGGKINGSVDWSRDGAYPVTVTGNLEIHGIKKVYTTGATINVEGGQITAATKFKVKVADHDIEIPRIVIKNIAEVVEVEVLAVYRKH